MVTAIQKVGKIMKPLGSGQGVALELRGRIKIGSILIMVERLRPEAVSVVKCLRSSLCILMHSVI